MESVNFSSVSPSSREQLQILAKSVYRDIREGGFSRSDLVHFAGELLELATHDAERDSNVPVAL